LGGWAIKSSLSLSLFMFYSGLSPPEGLKGAFLESPHLIIIIIIPIQIQIQTLPHHHHSNIALFLNERDIRPRRG
jgi:hypothetical protein